MAGDSSNGWIGTALFIGGILKFNLLSYLFEWGWMVW